MTLTSEGRSLTARFRRDQLAIRARMAREALNLWPLLDPWRLDATSGEWLRLMVALVLAFRDESARGAAGYYERLRSAELPQVEPWRSRWRDDNPAEPGAITTSLTVTGPLAIKQATGRAFRLAPEDSSGIPLEQSLRAAVDTALERVVGAAGRHVLDGGREVLRNEGARDTHALAFARVSDGDPCYFCALMISRGAVYRNADSAGRSANDRFTGVGMYKFHDGCACTIVPVFDRDTSPTSQEVKYGAVYEQAKKNSRASGEPVLDEFRWLVEGRARPENRRGKRS